MFLIVHNPLSNNRKSKKTTNKMVRFFKWHHIPFKVRSTLKIDDLNEYLDSHPTITDILYLGGDGSINYLINNVDVARIKQNIYLAKSGSGNDFLRTMKQIRQGDIVLGVAETDQKTVNFANGCGCGIDGAICHNVNNDSHKNKLSYFMNVFKAVFHYRRSDLEVVVDGVSHTFHNAFLVAIQNGRYFGGGMKIAPKGDPRSDTFQICVAHNLNNATILLLFNTIYPGLHIHIHKYVTMLEGKEIVVKYPDPRYFQADGEVTEDVKEIRIHKGATREFAAFSKRRLLQSLKPKK